ncbi:hypothetical protein [Nocardia macrotermitis]|uniref:Uncharacterized protein n=1 Tax=Nocardia macrotermitis TaxID=2585198 RepID=A0A7K0D6M0_9NOCA|nr:hypothetical protein [Nocardia macrotermitis]MQY21359.1 hypothetical protein [Nocardia macrotermitis]
MATLTLFLLVIAALTVYLHHRTGAHPAGSSNVVDRDAARIDHELRAILGIRETR